MAVAVAMKVCFGKSNPSNAADRPDSTWFARRKTSYRRKLRLEQVSRLRLVLPVPEHNMGVIVSGRILEFRVPAHPGRTFTAKLARRAGSLDPKTRTMSVEADVDNADGLLAPGMFPEVSWPIAREAAALLVPATAVVTTTERTFVIRVTAGKAEWVNVKKASIAGDLVEVSGN